MSEEKVRIWRLDWHVPQRPTEPNPIGWSRRRPDSRGQKPLWYCYRIEHTDEDDDKLWSWSDPEEWIDGFHRQ